MNFLFQLYNKKKFIYLKKKFLSGNREAISTLIELNETDKNSDKKIKFEKLVFCLNIILICLQTIIRSHAYYLYLLYFNYIFKVS